MMHRREGTTLSQARLIYRPWAALNPRLFQEQSHQPEIDEAGRRLKAARCGKASMNPNLPRPRLRRDRSSAVEGGGKWREMGQVESACATLRLSPSDRFSALFDRLPRCQQDQIIFDYLSI